MALNTATFWLTVWFLLNIIVTIMNKAFFRFYGFIFPVTLSMVHMISSAIGSYFVLRIGKFETQTLSIKESIPVTLFSVLFCANIVVGNSALRFVNVSLVQVVRSIIPGVTMGLSMLLLKKHYAHAYYYIIALVVAGVALASFGEVEFHMLGFLLTILVCFLSSLKSVMGQKFLVGKLRFHPFELLFRMSWLAALQMALLAYYMEYDGVLKWWEEHDGHGDVVASSSSEGAADDVSTMNHAQFAMMIVANGAMALALNVSNFYATKASSALTITILGNVKHVLTIVVSVLIFQNPISAMNAVGTSVTLIGAALYSTYDYKLRASNK